ncbi:MAG: hypothetical protein IJ054_02030 [Lachnospiraceae bacterium]|nr:hypothetical protein [Lachnospiraceae bacterium]MBQ9608710.1 hypothetical protein [Lachnospiraceae bacterium]
MSEKKKETNDAKENTHDPMAYVVPRLEGLLDILEELDMSAELMLDEGEVPYAVGEKTDGTLTYFTYIPFDLENEGQFVLQISRIVRDGSNDTETSLIDIASYNLESSFGFAVQDPQSGDIVLRAQVPEMGGTGLEWYAYIFEMFEDACGALIDALS